MGLKRQMAGQMWSTGQSLACSVWSFLTSPVPLYLHPFILSSVLCFCHSRLFTCVTCTCHLLSCLSTCDSQPWLLLWQGDSILDPRESSHILETSPLGFCTWSSRKPCSREYLVSSHKFSRTVKCWDFYLFCKGTGQSATVLSMLACHLILK